MKIKEINKEKHFWLILDSGKCSGKPNKPTIFKSIEEVKAKVNLNYQKDIFDKDGDIKIEVEKYTPPPPPTLNEKKKERANKYRAKRDNVINYDGIDFPVSALKFFVSMSGLTDDQLSQLLQIEPIKTETDYLVDTVKKVRDLAFKFNKHMIKNNNYVLDCEKASTETELNKIPDIEVEDI